MNNNKALVRVTNLTKYFPIVRGIFVQHSAGAIHAVDGVSFVILNGETLGLVGESGCGKTTIGRTIVRLHKPTSGSVNFNGVDVTNLSRREMRPVRKEMQMIFQDPWASLNPRMTVGALIREPLEIYRVGANRAEREDRVEELLQLVGMSPNFISRYPHEFSGGQRQRIGIARALAVGPKFMVCDEPISALDVSIQAQVVNLLVRLQGELGLTYLFIAHDLSVVRRISDRVAVMYLGKIVELAECRDLYRHPAHPYTRALLSAVPIPNPKTERTRKRIILEGDVPSPASPPAGCRFCTRCPIVADVCHESEPEWREIAPDHWTACHMI
jgi:oligopeptide transport system ATP-binding protein